MRRIFIAVIVIACLAGPTIWVLRDQLAGGKIRISINQQQIDAVLAEKFPKKKTYLKRFVVSYHNPRCELLQGNDRVRIAIDVTLTAGLGLGPLEKDFHGNAIITCGLGYDPQHHRILLKDATFEKIHLPKVKEQYLTMLETSASLTATEFFGSIPVYQIKDIKPGEALAKMILKDLKISDQKLNIVLGL